MFSAFKSESKRRLQSLRRPTTSRGNATTVIVNPPPYAELNFGSAIASAASSARPSDATLEHGRSTITLTARDSETQVTAPLPRPTTAEGPNHGYVYYSLYSICSPMSSRHGRNLVISNVGKTRMTAIPPPHTASTFKRHVVDIEDLSRRFGEEVDIDKVRLYLSMSDLDPAADDMRLCFRGGMGSERESPIIVVFPYEERNRRIHRAELDGWLMVQILKPVRLYARDFSSGIDASSPHYFLVRTKPNKSYSRSAEPETIRVGKSVQLFWEVKDPCARTLVDSYYLKASDGHEKTTPLIATGISSTLSYNQATSSDDRPIFYSLFSASKPLASRLPLSSLADAGKTHIGRTYSKLIPPPHTVLKLKMHIIALEIDAEHEASSLKRDRAAEAARQAEMFDSIFSEEPSPDDQIIRVTALDGPGATPENPLVFVIRLETESNVLVPRPFPKPLKRDNHTVVKLKEPLVATALNGKESETWYPPEYIHIIYKCWSCGLRRSECAHKNGDTYWCGVHPMDESQTLWSITPASRKVTMLECWDVIDDAPSTIFSPEKKRRTKRSFGFPRPLSSAGKG